MRWMVFFFLFLVACDSAPDAGRLDSAVAMIPVSVLPPRKPLWIVVDTLTVKTALGQRFDLKLLRESYRYYWMLGKDTVPTRSADIARLIHYKNDRSSYELYEDLDFLGWPTDSTMVFMEPLESFNEQNLCALAAYPADTLRKYDWVVKASGYDDQLHFSRTQVFPVQLDNDSALERIVEIKTSEWSTRYVILDSAAGDWKTAGTYNMNCRWEFPDTIVTSIYPYFGLLDHEWGSGYGSTSILLLRMGKDSVENCGYIYEFESFQSMPALYVEGGEPGDKYTRNSTISFQDGQLQVNYKVYTYVGWPTDTSEYFLLQGEEVPFTFRFSRGEKRFVPTGETGRWLFTIEPGTYQFDLIAYVNYRMRQIAGTGNKTQRRLLKHYAE